MRCTKCKRERKVKNGQCKKCRIVMMENYNKIIPLGAFPKINGKTQAQTHTM